MTIRFTPVASDTVITYGRLSKLRQRALRGRRLVAVDIENVIGGAALTEAQVVRARRSIEAAIGVRGDEHVVIGTSHCGLLAAGLGWRGSRLVVRSGASGADLALLEVLTGERIEQRFDEVLLVSGDGIFTAAVAALGAAGVRVTVVARPGTCSKRLRMATAHVLYVDYDVIGMGGAA